MDPATRGPLADDHPAVVIMHGMGLDHVDVDRRKALVGLTEADIKLILGVRDPLLATADANMAAFFAHISRYEGGKRLFNDPSLLERAKRMKADHLRAMLDGKYDEDYVRQRIELALIYSEVELDLKVFVGAFHDLMRNLGEQIMAAHLDDPLEGFHAFMAIKKIAFLDLTLITDVLIYQREVTIRSLSEDASQYARSLIESSLDPLVTISPDGKITDVNDATVNVTGILREHLIGSDFSDYFTEPNKAREGYKQVFAKGFVADYPLTIRHKDGKLTDVLYNASVYKDARGNVLGVFAAARDVTAQKQASQYARSLIEASLDPLVTISPDGKITDVNEGSVKVTGISRERLIGSDFSDYFTEPNKAREGYKQVFARGFVADYPLTIRHKDGKLTDVLYNASVYKDARGKVLGVFAAARDVTAQKQASLYARSLIEASLDPLVTISPDGKITDVNGATIRITGLTRGELIGTDFSTYFTEPDKAREGYQQVLSKKFVTDYPLTLRHESGKLIDVLYNASVYKDPSGKVLGVFAAARDVTAQKQASQYARSLIEASLDPLVTISAEGKITDVNEATVRATGLARDELVGTDFSTYFTEPRLAREGYKQVFAKGFVADYPLTIRHESGKLTDVLYNASVYKDPAGKVLGVFAAARDVTARKIAEGETAEASRLKASFLVNMSHEIRTPMNAVIALSELLLDTTLDAQQREMVQNMKTSGDHLLSVINNILDYSRLEAGRVDLERRSFDLRPCIEASLDIVALRASEHDLVLTYDLGDGVPPTIVGDQNRVRQVLVNLLTNAVKFTQKGEVVLRVQCLPSLGPGVLRFAISDTGMGIPPTKVDLLFKPFSQLDDTLTRNTGGTGLGLAISKRLVELMGGSIGVESVEGAGSTFHFTLDAPPGEPLVADKRDHSQLKDLRVLLVDDSLTELEIVTKLARSWAMSPITFSDPLKARAAVEAGQRVDLAILDYRMPGMNGIELAKHIHVAGEDGKPPTILVSAYHPDAKAIAEAGPIITGFISKPLRQSSLLNLVMDALGDGILRATESAPHVSPPTRTLRILLAEDHAMNQRIATMTLAKLGHRVKVVANGKEAIDAVSDDMYDVLFMDIQMPVMDGLTAATEICRRWEPAERPRMIAMTAHALPGDREKCLEAGMDDYVGKPFTLDDVSQALQRCEPRAGQRAVPITTPQAAPLVDGTVLERVAKDLGPSAVIELVEMYENDAPGLVDLLERAKREGGDALVYASHALAGSSRTIGGARVAQLSREIEALAKVGHEIPDFAARIATLRPLVQETIAELLRRAREHRA